MKRGDTIIMNKKSKRYYCDTHKFIRDIVHEYVNVTDFEMKIIDTTAYQRLKDVRQLTCQQVYPSARHTRFEHSLGVLELTRQAIKYINKNGIISYNTTSEKTVIDDSLQFNACIAALLHDIGHCPFSHLGELEFDKEEVRQTLIEVMKNDKFLKETELLSIIEKNEIKKIGAVHEQLSCIVILSTYKEILFNLDVEALNSNDEYEIQTDFELIIRSILGLEYDVSSKEKFAQNGKKNIVVRLINSKIIDMDKLDYIMRDSKLTGIGTPVIDTKRLFRNMYLDDNYSLIFTSRAIPVLQNIIDSRDGLYLYVYNHHVSVYSDFMNTYILRRLSHNSRDFFEIFFENISQELLSDEEKSMLNFKLGLISKSYLFSPEAIIQEYRADSDWLYILNEIYVCHKKSENEIKKGLLEEFNRIVENYDSGFEQRDFNDQRINRIVQKIENTYKLITNYKTRNFLKPWWKTVFEFTNFMTIHFQDDAIKSKLGKWICGGGDYGLEASEIRSQIAKHVIYITQILYNSDEKTHNGLVEPLYEGDFFVIERSNRFFEIDAIEELQIALKISEIIGTPKDINYSTSKYYIKNLTNIIPQKDYSSIYAKEGFYVFSKPVPKKPEESIDQKHYKIIEDIFVFVATEFIRRGEYEFIRLFNERNNTDQKEKLQMESMVNMLENYNKQKDVNIFK